MESAYRVQPQQTVAKLEDQDKVYSTRKRAARVYVCALGSADADNYKRIPVGNTWLGTDLLSLNTEKIAGQARAFGGSRLNSRFTKPQMFDWVADFTNRYSRNLLQTDIRLFMERSPLA
ncbi:hypothetical protein BaRGS_00017105 [Batillaria attramentaria]|uniref:Uncharacterized protein n=1 Tax=Batillaria attramentaria TaxID=370345 RepID=A0ABD0KXZ9_9CAEN